MFEYNFNTGSEEIVEVAKHSFLIIQYAFSLTAVSDQMRKNLVVKTVLKGRRSVETAHTYFSQGSFTTLPTDAITDTRGTLYFQMNLEM